MQLNEILAEHDLIRQTMAFSVSPTTKPVEPFEWDDNQKKDAHASDYLSWLNEWIDLPNDVEIFRASSKRDLFNTQMVSDKYFLKGTTDTAIIDKAYIRGRNYAAGLRVGIERKKEIEDKDVTQAIIELLMANLLSRYPVMILLTDLGSEWQFFWLQQGMIVNSVFGLKEGVALLESVVQEAGSTQPIDQDTPYRARCNFQDAVLRTGERNVPLSEESALEGLEVILRRPKVDIMSLFPKSDVADMRDVFDVMAPEEVIEWQKKRIFDLVMHSPALQPCIPENWRSM